MVTFSVSSGKLYHLDHSSSLPELLEINSKKHPEVISLPFS